MKPIFPKPTKLKDSEKLPKTKIINGIVYLLDTSTPEERLKSSRESWMKNKLWEKEQGFTLIPNGKAPIFYFREGNKLVSIAIELSGVDYLDLIIFDSNFNWWINLDTMDFEQMKKEESRAFKKKLINWMKSNGYMFSIGGRVIARRE